MFVIKEGTEGGKETPKEIRESIIKWLESEGMNVRSKDDEKSFIDSAVQDEVNSIMSKRNQQITDDIKSLTGIEPESNERYFDYMKRAVNSKMEGLTSEIETLKKNGKKSGENDQEIESLKSQIKDLEKLASDKDQEKEDLMKEFQQKENQQTLKSAVSQMKSKFKDLDEDILNDVIDKRLERFNSKYERKNIDGMEVIVSKEDGKPMRDNNGQPKTLDALVSDSFQDLIDESKAGKSGAGTGKGGSGQADPTAPQWKDLKGDIKSKNQVQLYDELTKEHKMDPDTKEFHEAFEGISSENELPLR